MTNKIEVTQADIPDTVERGYAAAENGEPNRPELHKFSEGWNIYHDSKYWDEIAEKIGAKVYGFTFRHGATFVFPNGDRLEASKGLLAAIATLRNDAQVREVFTTLREARDAFECGAGCDVGDTYDVCRLKILSWGGLACAIAYSRIIAALDALGFEIREKNDG